MQENLQIFFMKISNRVHRNISGVCLTLGTLLISLCIWEVAINPSSGKAWFELCGMMLLTYLQLDNFISYRKRVKEGILFGNKQNSILDETK